MKGIFTKTKSTCNFYVFFANTDMEREGKLKWQYNGKLRI